MKGRKTDYATAYDDDDDGYDDDDEDDEKKRERRESVTRPPSMCARALLGCVVQDEVRL